MQNQASLLYRGICGNKWLCRVCWVLLSVIRDVNSSRYILRKDKWTHLCEGMSEKIEWVIESVPMKSTCAHPLNHTIVEEPFHASLPFVRHSVTRTIFK